MTAETKSSDSPLSKPGMSMWLAAGAWGVGTVVYLWLLSGVIFPRDYRNLTFVNLGWLELTIASVLGGVTTLMVGKRAGMQKESSQLFRIVVAVLPALFFVSALAVLTLTLTTYNADWKEARQGIATAFAALIAAVGVVISVAVTYKTGEENRLVQKVIEQQKLDAELIKNLNDRLHDIIPRRYGKDNADEVSASFFQLASLYKDWETLAATSSLVELQKNSQQRNILKLLFGVYQEPKTMSQDLRLKVHEGESGEFIDQEQQQTATKEPFRSELDIRTLNSVIQDIFPKVQKNIRGSNKSQVQERNTGETEDKKEAFDLSYLDLRGLNFSERGLSNANLQSTHLEGANLESAHLEDANLENAHLEDANLKNAHLEDAILWDVHLEDASLWNAHLEGAYLGDVHLEGAYLENVDLKNAILWNAHLEGAFLGGAYLEGAFLGGAHLEDTRFFRPLESLGTSTIHEQLINRLKTVKKLPEREDFLKAQDFDEALVNQIFQAHRDQGAYKAQSDSTDN